MTVLYNHFPLIAKAFEPALKRIVEKTATGIQEVAAINAPKDTGFLADSIYVRTSTKSTYGKATRISKTGKRSRRKIADTSLLLPEVDAPPDDLTAYAAVGASYGAYVNYGTRFMAAQPFWEPAVEFMQPLFQQYCDEIEAMIKGLSGL